MNKIKLLMLLIMAATGMTASAADAGFEFVESDGGKTLTIKGYGDLTTLSQTSTTTVFSAAANGNIFTNNSGTSVNAQDDYNPSATYYYAEGGYTQVFDGGAPTNGQSAYDVATTTAWDEAAISANDTYIYLGYIQTWGDHKLVINSDRITSGTRDNYETIQYNDKTYTQYVKLNSPASYGTWMDPNESYLLTEAQLASYLTSTTIYKAGQNQILYRSQDGGATKEKLTSGQVYTYNAGDLFYVANSTPTYVQIADNAAYFAANPSYLENAETVTTFKDALLEKITSGAYTKVVFENTGSGELTINSDITKAILKPNNIDNSNIVELDLGQATTISTKEVDLTSTAGYGYKITSFDDFMYSVSPANLEKLTLPLVRKDGDDMVMPAIDGLSWSTKLKEVTVPVGYTKIGNAAFTECIYHGAPKKVNLPEGLKEIGDRSFYSLVIEEINITGAPVEGRSIVLPSTLETIGNVVTFLKTPRERR